MEKIRLQKFFTDAKVMSRRAAEEAILAGTIKVNGQPASLGQKVDPDTDTVEYNGQTIEYPKNDARTYIILNKPRGYVTTMSDEHGRKCVTELIGDVGTRVYPVGRLDMDSEGLLLFTDDGELANALTHPRHSVPKIYHVKLAGLVPKEKIDELRKPMTLDDGYTIMPVKTELISQGQNNDDSTTIKMTLFEGHNRQIRRMCKMHGLKILRLCRVGIGDIRLGNLAPAKWRRLSENQINYLKTSCGLK